ncbi:MAG: acetoacetate--CoA ligase [Sphingomonadales bacterium]|nr:MAG: acetoacetate--CoA ligase [Sphingomonadales bacterium]
MRGSEVAERVADNPVPQLRLYRDWLRTQRDREFADYAALWEWSTSDLAGFWQSIWDYHGLDTRGSAGAAISGEMPFATWFPGTELNYVRQIFGHAERADAAGQPAIIASDERGHTTELSWAELRRRTASLALELRRQGIGRGDRVAAYLPNIPEAVVAMLATASLGAIWTMCSPDMGTPAVLDRLRQIEPKALIAIDGVFYGGRRKDRSAAVEELRRGLPSLVSVFAVQTGHGDAALADAVDFSAAQARDDDEVAAFEPEWVPFDHPLWILYSSGTTGLPKAIVHGHGGVILTTCAGNLHMDIGASYSANTFGERFHWYSATGWVMWNVQVGGLLAGATICLFDGSPRGSGDQAEWTPLWAFAERHRVTWFGAGAAFFASCQKAGMTLASVADLGRIRALGSTGSPLPASVQQWGTDQFAAIGRPDIWWCNISGGTDIAAAFMSGNRELPPTPGRLQCRHLGAAIEAWDEHGAPLTGEVGELVCTRPFPSMPLFFWGDEGGSRYRATYFDHWPGVWRHGDWLIVGEDGSCTITGRSDATINRHGVRMGTADIYAAVEVVPGVADSLVIELEDGAGESRLLMFVVCRAGQALDPALEQAMTAAIRSSLSPRFVPDRFVAAPAIPRTLSGKKQELPIKRLFQGWPVAKVLDPNLAENPETLPWYCEQAAIWLEQAQTAERQVAANAQ